MVDELRPKPDLFSKGDSGVFELCCCKTLATDADRIKNFPGVVGKSDPDLGAGEADNLTLLTDFLNALATGVETNEAKEVTLDIVFLRFDSTLVDETSPSFAVKLRLESTRCM